MIGNLSKNTQDILGKNELVIITGRSDDIALF